jgi:hypothetical protein
MRRAWICLALFALSLAAVSGSAQDFSIGSIHGRVRDASGSPLRDVEVGLIDLSIAKPITAHTDIAGEFSFTSLRTGRYSLSFELENYAVQRLGPYEVLPDSPVEIAVQLESLSRPLTRPTTGLEGIALEYGLVREQIEAVPVLVGTEGRTALDKLLLLVPGMSPVESLEVNPFSGRGAAVSANGSRRSAINYQLDGASNNAQNRLTGSQAATYGPAPEAIETFRVITHTYSARDGRNAGAVVAPVTRSGGNNWHGQARGFWRPHLGNRLESFDGSSDSVEGVVGGGQVGGPLASRLFLLLDGEMWRAQRRHTAQYPVLSFQERQGDFSSDPATAPVDPETGQLFVNGRVPESRFDPLMQKYLDTFVPEPNVFGEALHQAESNFESTGEMFLGRLDYRLTRWSIHASHVGFRNEVRDPLSDFLTPSPRTVARRRQLSHNAQLSFIHTPTPRITHAIQLSGQRLSIGNWTGHLDYHDTSADTFGFEYARISGVDPGTIPDVTLFTNTGAQRFRIAPFVSSESSVETTYQIRNDFEYRPGGHAIRGGVLYRRGMWPFTNTENFAGNFDFTADAFQGARNSVANLLMGVPGRYRLQSPRSLHLRWKEFAFYSEGELRVARGLQLTAGIRYESQPPATDRLDRIAAFREDVTTQKFPNTLPNLIFPGDPDPLGGVLPRSTIRADGRKWAPRFGVAFSPGWENRLSRWILGESGRSVFRASYGVFYDFGTFAGSSATALFRATYPPWSTDNRFEFSRLGAEGSFSAPLSSIPRLEPGQIVSNQASYPILVFDPDFDNARAQHWTVGWQRLLPGRVFASAVFVGTRTLSLQRQRELNVFERNPVLSFAFVDNMRRFSLYRDIRSFESSGSGKYQGVQLRANRYLSRGLAFDFSYTWSESRDNGSNDFGDELITEPWAASSFDRTHTFTASWFYQWRLPRDWSGKLAFLDNWQISGLWRWRSGLPLDIRQTKDPTYSFQRIGRPDLVGEFRLLDPSDVRTFTLQDGRTITGRFAFDPTVFQKVEPEAFSELRPGTATRNAFRMQGYQQWDLRLTRQVAVSEVFSADFSFDFFNVFNNRNWDFPFTNIDHPYFGIVRTEGLARTFQLSLRLIF